MGKKNCDLEMQKIFGLLFVGSNIDKMYEMCIAWSKGCEEKKQHLHETAKAGSKFVDPKQKNKQ